MITGTDTGLKLSFLKKGADQIGVLVEDLDKAVEMYWRTLGIGPWRLYTYGKPFVPRMTYRGRPGDYRMRIAMASMGPLQVELIQPLAGESIYAEHVREHGYGMHHLGFWVEDLQAARAEAEAAGLCVVMDGEGYGLDGDGGYAYLNTGDLIGITLEIIEVPQRRVQPEAVYPE